MSDQIKIDEIQHLIQPWRVHTLLPDFKLEDVWRVPVILKAEHSFEQFLDVFTKSNNALIKDESLAGILFKFRIFLGKVFKWDEKSPIVSLVAGSIRERYAIAEGLSFEDLIEPGNGDFIPVYKLENEFLSEIENKTVHAALHLGKVHFENGFTIQMAIYVKPKGWFGRIYMQVIKPFRHWIVYPALMQSARKSWERFLDEEQVSLRPI